MDFCVSATLPTVIVGERRLSLEDVLRVARGVAGLALSRVLEPTGQVAAVLRQIAGLMRNPPWKHYFHD